MLSGDGAEVISGAGDNVFNTAVNGVLGATDVVLGTTDVVPGAADVEVLRAACIKGVIGDSEVSNVAVCV